MKRFAFLLISIQKPLTIETLVDFPIANVLLIVPYELPVAYPHNAIGTHLFTWNGLPKDGAIFS